MHRRQKLTEPVSDKGFTTAEILLLLAIVAILAAVCCSALFHQPSVKF